TDFTINAIKSGKSEVIRTSESTREEHPEVTALASVSESSAPTETVQLVRVYICGEVINPGIYEAPKGVILNDIIEDAGGLTDEASVNNINFVYQITCNMSIYIPSKAETANGFSGGDIIRQDGVYVWGNQQGGSADSGSTSISIVNINTATVDELKTLPGIGEVTAQAIVDYRAKNPFKTKEDIKNVTGIGDSKYNRIKDYISV
ncbi:MAG: ComEA family DNA-binding protein, partial [Clostridiales bacterium]|nr:ComEA family DNA-binding protein [Clostridiales bacterium]